MTYYITNTIYRITSAPWHPNHRRGLPPFSGQHYFREG